MIKIDKINKLNDYKVKFESLVKCPTCNSIAQKGKWICLPVYNAMYEEHGFGHSKDTKYFLYACPSCGALKIITDDNINYGL